MVEVMDTNNNRPEFKDCDKYKPRLMEHAPVGTSVITVSNDVIIVTSYCGDDRLVFIISLDCVQ